MIFQKRDLVKALKNVIRENELVEVKKDIHYFDKDEVKVITFHTKIHRKNEKIYLIQETFNFDKTNMLMAA